MGFIVVFSYMYTIHFNCIHPFLSPFLAVTSFLFLSSPALFCPSLCFAHLSVGAVHQLAIVGPESFTCIFPKTFKI